MIRPRRHLNNIKRDIQPYDNKDGILRLDMNEYVPGVAKELYKELNMALTEEVISAYPMVNSAYASISKLIGIPQSKIVLTNGSDGVALSVLQAFCNPGDKVASIVPTYGMYEVYSQMMGLKFIPVEYKGFEIDEREILDLITEDLKVFIIANPNGNLGGDLSFDFIEKIIKKGNECGTLILLDEVYAAFVDYGKSRYAILIDKYDNLVIARSFSKSYGLAGLRVGYSISNEITRKYLIAVRNNVEINSAAVTAINIWCKYPEILKSGIEEINRTKEYLVNNLDNIGFVVCNTKSNFILVKIDQGIEKLVKEKYEAEKIAVKWMNISGEKWIRVTVGTREYMKRFLETMKKIAQSFGKSGDVMFDYEN